MWHQWSTEKTKFLKTTISFYIYNFGDDMKELKSRKKPCLPGYDYSTSGAYFITVCTENRRCILSRVVGGNVLFTATSLVTVKITKSI